MGRWMFSVCIMVVEAWGNVYFFDTFLGRKKGIFFCRYRFPAYLAMMFAASTAGYWIDMWKLPVYILGYILLGRVCYQAGWIQGIYFSMLNYSMIFLTDLMLVSLMDLWETQEAIWGIWSVPGALFAKACWIVFIFLFRRVWKEVADLRLMSSIINCEAGIEPYQGKLAVGIVVMNRIKSKSFPNTLRGVIYQRGQFSPVRNGSLNRRLSEYDSGRIKSKQWKTCINSNTPLLLAI